MLWDELVALIKKAYTKAIAAVGLVDSKVEELKKLNRFLDYWDCSTGTSLTEPPTEHYTYKTGDFFRVVKVGSTNYKPYGTEWSPEPSIDEETEDVKRDDIYYYNGTVFTLIDGGRVNFSEIGGNATDNLSLNTALDAKADKANTVVYSGEYDDAIGGTFTDVIPIIVEE